MKDFILKERELKTTNKMFTLNNKIMNLKQFIITNGYSNLVYNRIISMKKNQSLFLNSGLITVIIKRII